MAGAYTSWTPRVGYHTLWTTRASNHTLLVTRAGQVSQPLIQTATQPYILDKRDGHHTSRIPMAVYYTLWSQGPATKHFGPKSQQPYTSGYKGRSSQPATYPSSYSEVPLMLCRVAACHGIHRSNNIGYFWWINHRIRLVICAIESYETWRNINIL